ncbi:hypothetical protein [Olsenella porci]|uniref:DUF4405 domain-containing protein n=1 Tax=Olsenella porci TaxID=2652279 RepID=A0A6N7XRB1_9ACTN|nr:hypothetical protein [Olsenella porci]MST72459.1 hypothetical protein [Olsenella porci]
MQGNMRKGMKVLVDVAMLLDLAFLVARSLTGFAIHEWLGIGFFVLVIAHNLLNRPWWKTLRRGRWTPLRVVVAVPILLLAGMGVVLLLTIGPLTTALPLRLPSPLGVWTSRSVHAGLACWIYVLAQFHVGTHCGRGLRGWWRSAKGSARLLSVVVCLALLALGSYDFVVMGFPVHLAFAYGFTGVAVDAPVAYGVLEVLLAGSPFVFLGALARMLSGRGARSGAGAA